MKYKINNPDARCADFYTVRLISTGKIVSKHEDSAEAHEAAQRYVNEDRDFAMEGR